MTTDADVALATPFPSTARNRESDEATPMSSDFLIDDENDWSVTLDGIGRLADDAKTYRDRLAAAERRAELAEKKAEQALFWLRRIHQAVVEAMPERTPVKGAAPLSRVA